MRRISQITIATRIFGIREDRRVVNVTGILRRIHASLESLGAHLAAFHAAWQAIHAAANKQAAGWNRLGKLMYELSMFVPVKVPVSVPVAVPVSSIPSRSWASYRYTRGGTGSECRSGRAFVLGLIAAH